MSEKYVFNISLSVLNHLGRNLYRNIITIIGEAISNSWDADAHSVWISIDKKDKKMIIKDDGVGMSSDDFQNKFLKIGYSKRKDGNYKSVLNRPFIGRKGIGKLALLSCAEKIHVASKKEGREVIGGTINNSELDQAITDDLNSQDYELEPLNDNDYIKTEELDHGTYILFEKINTKMFNTIDYIKKAIALYFKFSMIDPSFNIYMNEELIDENTIVDLAKQTQFLWIINDIEDPYLSKVETETEPKHLKSTMRIKGYIASVHKPSDLKIKGTQEKLTIDLFVNGRLREKDILRHFPTARIVENYVYGQIHYDELDTGDKKDIFTSNREGIISDAPDFQDMLKEIERIFKEVIEDWDKLRREQGDDGDVDNQSIKPEERKAQELFNVELRGISGKSRHGGKGGVVDQWVKELRKESQYNIPSYTDCFIAENLLRKYIIYEDLKLSKNAIDNANKWEKQEKKNKDKANISYDIRKSNEDIYYLDMSSLATFIDKAKDQIKDPALSRSADTYKPLRDAIGHTSLITDVAKQELSIVLENIKARVSQLLKEIEEGG